MHNIVPPSAQPLEKKGFTVESGRELLANFTANFQVLQQTDRPREIQEDEKVINCKIKSFN
jgi:hypothetical protein